MEQGKRVKEMSFLRPDHAVDLVERALEVGGSSVVCVARSEFKVFIAFQLFQEVWRRTENAGKMVLLVDDEKAGIVKPFLSATTNQSMLSVKTFFDEKNAAREERCSLSSCDVMVTKGEIFLQNLKAGIMDLMSFSLIIFDECHLASDADHPFAMILKHVEGYKVDLMPKIVGLSVEIVQYQECPQDIERFLNTLEELFCCKVFISYDLLALNRYGEQAEEEIMCYTCTLAHDQLICKLKKNLQDALLFLKDITVHEATQECVIYAKHILTECHKVLLFFGTQHTAYIAGIALKDIKKLEKKCTESYDLLILQFCRTQMNFIINLSKQDELEDCKDNLTDLTAKLLFHMSSHVKPEYKEDSSCQATSSYEDQEASPSKIVHPHHNFDNLPTSPSSTQLAEFQPVAMANSKQSQTNCTVASESLNFQTTTTTTATSTPDQTSCTGTSKSSNLETTTTTMTTTPPPGQTSCTVTSESSNMHTTTTIRTTISMQNQTNCTVASESSNLKTTLTTTTLTPGQTICTVMSESSSIQTTTTTTSMQSQTNCTVASESSNLQTTYGSNNQCDDPLCVILVPSTIIAKALNSLINKLSNTSPEYSFLKSACVRGNKTKQEMFELTLSGETGDNVMECVQDGSVNVLVATFEVERELYARRCSLLIRLGMPKDYKHYLNVKKKLKSAGAKLVVLIREEEKARAEETCQVFKRIENLLMERCTNSRPPCREVKKLFDKEQLEAYEPYGEEGPKVDLLSSISLVNSYCAKFPSSGVGAAVPVCRTEEVWTDDHVQFVSTLYLPRNSPVYWPIKGSATLKRNEVNKQTARKARINLEMRVALETCRQLHKAQELSEDLQPMYRFQMLSLAAESVVCDCEVADSGAGMDGSVKRNRAYKRKFPAILEDNFPVCGEPSHLYSVTMELTKPWTFERAIRSRSKAQSLSVSHCLGILSRKPLPKLPGMLIFDRAGEVTVTVAECTSHPVVLNSDQLSLIQRFTGYNFKDIAKPKNASGKTFPNFDPTTASSGYYVVLLKDAQVQSSPSVNGLDHKEIAFNFMQSIEDALGNFDNPTDPPPPGIQDMELFKDAVVTAIYNENCPRYYVADICYDRSPADPFPNSETAATFAEYFKIRYGAEVTLEQPMLDVDHISSRLNFLLPRYQNIKGQNLAVPEKDSKRSQKSKVFVVPELCSIHPVPGYLWRQLFILPAVLYRMESLLVAEELRSTVARALGRGAVEWPNDVPLPLLTMGEMVGEEIMREANSVAENLEDKPSPEVGPETNSVAEEFRDKYSLGVGPDKSNTDMVGEETVCEINSVADDLKDKPPDVGPETNCVAEDLKGKHCHLGTGKPNTEMLGEEIVCRADSEAEKSSGMPLDMVADTSITLHSTELVGENIMSQTDSEAETSKGHPVDAGLEKTVTSCPTDSMSEEIICETDCATEKSRCKPCGLGKENGRASQHTDLCEGLTNVRITEKENLDTAAIRENRPFQGQSDNSNASPPSFCDSMAKNKTSSLPATSEVNKGGAKMDTSESEHVFGPVQHDTPVGVDHRKTVGAVDTEASSITIWTDPFLSSLYKTCGPPPTLILRALTTCSAGDVFSLERLEMLGDSFVKYAISSSVFFEHRHQNEGKLSFIRGLKVSNRQLFYLARQRGLPLYMFTRMFAPLVNWMPPGFYYEDGTDAEGESDGQLFLLPDKSSQEVEEEDEDGSLFAQEELSGPTGLTHHSEGSSSEAHSPSIRLNPYLHHCCSDKAIADTTEALIGAYLLCYGPEGAWSLLEWLGMELTKQEESEDAYTENTPLVEENISLGAVEVDSAANSLDVSKRPCTACQTFDKALLHLQEKSDTLCSANDLSTLRSTATKFTTPEEVLSSNKSQAFCQTFGEALVQQQASPDSFPSDSSRFSDLTSSANEITTLEESLNYRCPNISETTCQKLDGNLFQLDKRSEVVPVDSALLSSHISTAAGVMTLEEVLNNRSSEKPKEFAETLLQSGETPNPNSTKIPTSTEFMTLNENETLNPQLEGQKALLQPQNTTDSLLSDSAPFPSHRSSVAEFTTVSKTMNPQSEGQKFHKALLQPQKTPGPVLSNSALLSSHRSSSAEFTTLEEALNYHFNDHSLLQQAFTHTSLPRDYNSVRSSYEQLEFLGDALLDYLVTRHLYVYHRHMSPGDLTDLRSAVVNNYSFATLAVKLGLAKHLRSVSPSLFTIVNKFIVKLKEKEMRQQQANCNEIYSSVFVMGSEDGEESVEVEVPKALGDLFEAVAGALFVDCGQDLETVSQVYLPILKPSIDYYSANPPMSAIRRLLEMMPNASKFAPIERMVDGKFKSTLTVSGFGTFVGMGRNFRIAKSTAAQRALSVLQQKKAQKKVENT